MALDSIVYNDELILTFTRGNMGIVSSSLFDMAVTTNVPIVQPFTPEQALTF